MRRREQFDVEALTFSSFNQVANNSVFKKKKKTKQNKKQKTDKVGIYGALSLMELSWQTQNYINVFSKCQSAWA